MPTLPRPPAQHRGGTGGWWWTWWVAEQHHTECCADSRICSRTGQLHLGRRAAIGSQNASGYQLATGDPVMPIGGFNGSDPSPTSTSSSNLLPGRDPYFIGGQW